MANAQDVPNVPRKGPPDDLRRELQIMREENNFKAATRGMGFVLRLALLRLLSKPTSTEATADHSRRQGSWSKRATLGVSGLGSLWVAVSPRAHLYLITVAEIILHLWHAVMGS